MKNVQTIAVTGAGGFLGSALLYRLLENEKCAVKVHSSHSLPIAKSKKARQVVGELSDPEVCRQVCAGAHTLIHFATRGFPSNSRIASIRDNLSSSQTLFEAMKAKGVQRLVLVSSGGAVYSDAGFGTKIAETFPTEARTAYAAYKLAIEELAEEYRNDGVFALQTLRVANPYGPGQYGRTQQGLLGVAMQSALEGRPLKLWAPEDTVKDFLFIEDLVDLFMKVLQTDELGDGIYNVGSGSGTSLRRALELVEKVTEKKLNVQHQKSDPIDPLYTVLDCTKIENLLHWSAKTSLLDGLTYLMKSRLVKSRVA